MKQKPEHEIGKPLAMLKVCVLQFTFFRPTERKAEMDPGPFA